MNYSRNGILKKQRELNNKGNKIRKMFGITFIKAILIVVISAGALGLCLGIGMWNGILANAPDIATVDVSPTGYATTLYDSEGHEMVKLVAANSNRTYVTIDMIPENLQHAFVAIEDERFYEHNGIDIIGILRAGVTVVKEKSAKSGASTITQQLIKNNVFSETWATEDSFMESVTRKLQEQYLATELEKTMSKNQILELYMNSINLGQNTLGVQAASLRYFDKPVYMLDLSECACIAAITQNPSRWNPISHPDNNKGRRDEVLRKMCKQGYITEAERDAAIAEDIYSTIEAHNEVAQVNNVYSYFVDEVVESVSEDLTAYYLSQGLSEQQAKTKSTNMLYSGGLSIYTTQDPQIQATCDEIYNNEDNYPDGTKWLLSYQLTIENANGEKKNYSTEMYKTYYQQFNPNFNLLYTSQDDAYAAVEAYENAILEEEGGEITAENVSLTPQPQVSLTVADQYTGHVLAIVGGRGVKETSRSLNRATNTTRQPGSTFKILAAYAPALDIGAITLATTYNDAPYNYANGRPVSNWYGKNTYKGICSARYGIEQSLNIVTVKVLTDITPQVGFQYVKDFGISTVIDHRLESDNRITTDIQQALALGGITDGVTNTELNAAYAAIANKGVYLEPIFYTKIVDSDGNVLIDKTNQQKTRRVIETSTAFLLTTAMQDVVTKGTGASVNFGTMNLAGKTGTTSSSKDVWFAGFSPYYTVTTWTGYDNNVELAGAESNLSKTMWRAVMSKLSEGQESIPFYYGTPAGVTTCTVCASSGKLPVAGLCDGHTKTEYFAEGTVPTETCDVHYSGNVCLYSGLRACDTCPFKVAGTLELPVIESEANQAGSRVSDENGNIIDVASSSYCPHNNTFFTTAGYAPVLQQQRAELATKGFYFSLVGYIPGEVDTVEVQVPTTED